MRTRQMAVVGAVCGLALASSLACGSEDEDSRETPTTTASAADVDEGSSTPTTVTADPSTTVTTPADDEVSVEMPPEPGRMQLGLVECVQFAMVAHVDAASARSLVQDGVEVVADEDGLATFTQVSKTCGDMTVDGVSLGPGHFDTQWITTVGPMEQRSVPDQPVVLPTDYLYPLGFATDNDAVQQAVSAFGVPMISAELEMGPLGPGAWSGSARSPDGDYDWTVDNTAEGGMSVFFVHVLERSDAGLGFHFDIECPSIVAWGPGEASIRVAAGSSLHQALGPEITGQGYGVELTCDVTIDRTVPFVVTEDIAYSETQQLDVYAPATGADWPVVVFFHGGLATREDVAEAEALAGRGLVVYVPSWRSTGPAGGSEDTVCAVAFAQATADRYGGDASRTTLSGYSTGGLTAGVHALIGEDGPLQSSDCLVEPAMELPIAVVTGGTPFFAVAAARAGAFADNPQWNVLTPEQLDAFDPYLALGRNPDVRFVLVVGADDRGGGALGDIPINDSNLEYHDALVAAGYDTDLVVLDGGHEIVPGTERFRTWVEAIADAAHGTGSR